MDRLLRQIERAWEEGQAYCYPRSHRKVNGEIAVSFATDEPSAVSDSTIFDNYPETRVKWKCAIIGREMRVIENKSSKLQELYVRKCKNNRALVSK